MPAPDNSPRVLFAGGGTGGHLYPAIAIADALRAQGAAIAFAGSSDRLEASIVPRAGYTLHPISARPLTRRPSFDFVRTVVANVAGALQSVALLLRMRPHAVIATGGYVCFPVVVAARALRWLHVRRMAIALLEPNAKPGLTNRLLVPLVDEIWTAFHLVWKGPKWKTRHLVGKSIRTGVPVRASLRALPSRDRALAVLGLDAGRNTLLVMGGSQGARALNDAVVAMVRDGQLPPNWQLLLVAGEREYARVRGEIPAGAGRVVSYLDDMAPAYASADLAIARAGASTLAELAATAVPAILVPYPFAADDHQTMNAALAAQTGAALIIADRDLAGGALSRAIVQATAAPALSAMKASAAQLGSGDPVATILARVECLASRRDKPAQ